MSWNWGREGSTLGRSAILMFQLSGSWKKWWTLEGERDTIPELIRRLVARFASAAGPPLRGSRT